MRLAPGADEMGRKMRRNPHVWHAQIHTVLLALSLASSNPNLINKIIRKFFLFLLIGRAVHPSSQAILGPQRNSVRNVMLWHCLVGKTAPGKTTHEKLQFCFCRSGAKKEWIRGKVSSSQWCKALQWCRRQCAARSGRNGCMVFPHPQTQKQKLEKHASSDKIVLPL
jgi:hypothetical protein